MDPVQENQKNLSLVIPMSLLGYTGITGNFVIEPGPVEVSAGSSSNDIRSTAKITITGKDAYYQRRASHVPLRH